MRFPKTLTFLILAAGLVFALPALARQKSVEPSSAGPRPNAVRPYVALAAAMPALPPPAQQKPFTQEQVSNMVRDGFGDESGAKLIEQRGIDFAPSEDFIQTLKAAGASEAFLNALRAAVAPGLSPAHAALKGGSTTVSPPASAKKPLNQVQVFALLVGQVPHPPSATWNVHERRARWLGSIVLAELFTFDILSGIHRTAKIAEGGEHVLPAHDARPDAGRRDVVSFSNVSMGK